MMKGSALVPCVYSDRAVTDNKKQSFIYLIQSVVLLLCDNSPFLYIYQQSLKMIPLGPVTVLCHVITNSLV